MVIPPGPPFGALTRPGAEATSGSPNTAPHRRSPARRPTEGNMADVKRYTPRDYSKVRGLNGISDKQIEEHLKLYEGYVKRTNALTEKLQGICADGKASGADPVFAELTRRLGFEYSGMVNHEYYFENMAPGAQPEPPAGGKLRTALEASFGKYETWLADFRAIATMPGVGWAMLFQDPRTGWLSNHWLNLHMDNAPIGF